MIQMQIKTPDACDDGDDDDERVRTFFTASVEYVIASNSRIKALFIVNYRHNTEYPLR